MWIRICARFVRSLNPVPALGLDFLLAWILGLFCDIPFAFSIPETKESVHNFLA